MKIYLVRHGEAVSPEADPERPLTPKGRSEVERMAQFLAKSGAAVAQIMHSPKLRAQETAEIFAGVLKAPLSVCPTILDSEAEVLPAMSMLPSLNADTMLVGHLPMVAKLVSALVIHDENYYPITNYKPGTIVCLMAHEGRWIIDWMLAPGLLP